ncbi:MAG: hypothetical protein EBR82_51820 [Caulobacteraceae bacterium]|nr:hypothetical protein [Caulobacteraceae bacterium]
MRIYDNDDEPVMPRPMPIWAMVVWALAALALLLMPLACRAEYEVEIVQKFTVEVVSKQKPPAKPTKPVTFSNNPWVETATGTTSDRHLIEVHGFTAAQLRGLTQDQKNRLHGAAHEAPRATVSNCPNGQCPLPTRRGRR